MMARKWMWLLAGVFVAAFVSFAWWPEVTQPEGCPQDGCRVGYRFEDGGRAPEGWEPFETDDPVVANLDLCFSAFMAGVNDQTQELVEVRESDTFRLQTTGVDETVLIGNWPAGSRYGVFRCNGAGLFEASSQPEVEEWIKDRFEDRQEWTAARPLPQIVGDAPWSVRFRGFEANVLIQNSLRDGQALIRIEIATEYRGPELVLGAMQDIAF